MSRTLFALAGAFALLTVAVRAQTPAASYPVTPQVGPWMICVASYRGEDSRLKAEEMCGELRSVYKVPAFCFNRADEERKKENERVAAQRAQQKERLKASGLPEDTPIRVKTIRIEDQFAVLVGGFKDDVGARKYLDEIRKLKAPEKLQQIRYVPGPTGKMQQEAVNPFQSAFVCRNPTVSVAKAEKSNEPDPRLKEYNSGESFSLLKCKQPWTLVVKSYSAAAVVQSQQTSKSVMEKALDLGKSEKMLMAGAIQAHEVAEFLRKFKYEAYVLHTEYSSYVTIGGYAAADDPKLLEMLQKFTGEMSRTNSNIWQMHTVGGVQFFSQPMPMQVPQLK